MAEQRCPCGRLYSHLTSDLPEFRTVQVESATADEAPKA